MLNMSTWIRMISNTTQEECQAIAEDLLQLAQSPRDDAWRAKFDAAIAKYQDPKDSDLTAHIGKWKAKQGAWADALDADGMGHSTLIKAELARRGDDRNVPAYLADVVGPHAAAASDVVEALRDLG